MNRIVRVQPQPMFRSAKEILDAGYSTGDGVYTICVDGNPIDAYCNMTTDGGGWTLWGKFTTAMNGTAITTAAINPQNLTDLSLSTYGKHTDAFMESIRGLVSRGGSIIKGGCLSTTNTWLYLYWKEDKAFTVGSNPNFNVNSCSYDGTYSAKGTYAGDEARGVQCYGDPACPSNVGRLFGVYANTKDWVNCFHFGISGACRTDASAARLWWVRES